MITKVTGTEAPTHVTIALTGDTMTRMTRQIISVYIASRKNIPRTRVLTTS